MQINNKYRRMWRKTRAVSPVIAAILLIGLAVLAGAAVTFIVLPFIQSNPDLAVSSVVGIDQNGDSRMDKITVTVTNSGTAADTFDLTDSSFTGALNWAATTADETSISSASIGGVDIVFKTTNVQNQLATSDTWSITLAFTTSDDMVISSTDTEVSVAAKVITNANLQVSDFTDSNWMVTSTSGAFDRVDFEHTDANRESTGGANGVRIRTDDNGGSPELYLVQSNVANGLSIGAATNLNTETQVWSKDANPVVGFYMSIDNSINQANTDLRVYFEAFSGSNDVGNFYFDLTPTFSSGSYNANEWVLVLLDFSDTSLWTGFSAVEQSADSVGGFAIRIDNDETANWDVHIDDIFVASGL